MSQNIIGVNIVLKVIIVLLVMTILSYLSLKRAIEPDNRGFLYLKLRKGYNEDRLSYGCLINIQVSFIICVYVVMNMEGLGVLTPIIIIASVVVPLYNVVNRMLVYSIGVKTRLDKGLMERWLRFMRLVNPKLYSETDIEVYIKYHYKANN